MTASLETLTGGCACGAVRFVCTDAPLRVGLCHCLVCRKAHASAFNPFVVFRADQVVVEGTTAGWVSSQGYNRRFCPVCGSRVLAIVGDEVELSLGSLDEVGRLAPQYESWSMRREPWLKPLKTPQYKRNREG